MSAANTFFSLISIFILLIIKLKSVGKQGERKYYLHETVAPRPAKQTRLNFNGRATPTADIHTQTFTHTHNRTRGHQVKLTKMYSRRRR